MKTTWRKMESWRPGNNGAGKLLWFAHRNGADGFMETLDGATGNMRRFATFSAALRAANKQNRLEGLPLVS